MYILFAQPKIQVTYTIACLMNMHLLLFMLGLPGFQRQKFKTVLCVGFFQNLKVVVIRLIPLHTSLLFSLAFDSKFLFYIFVYNYATPHYWNKLSLFIITNLYISPFKCTLILFFFHSSYFISLCFIQTYILYLLLLLII